MGYYAMLMMSLIMSRVAERGTSLLTQLIRREPGYATMMAILVLLFMGAIIITPILVYMDTGLEAGQTHERRTDELYAADAGVNLAMWHLQHGGLELEIGQVAEFPSEEFPAPININDKNVHVMVENVTPSEEDKPVYQITSTAESDDTDSSTTVEAYVSPFHLSDNAITSLSGVNIQSKSCEVHGNVQLGGTLESPGSVDPVDVIEGDIRYDVDDILGIWPTPESLSGFYRRALEEELELPEGGPLPEFPDDRIDVEDFTGPLYRDGSLTVKKTAGSSGLVELEGTIYVTGDLVVEPDCTIDMNGQTIYAEGSITFQPGSTVSGSGCIVAVGYVELKPIFDSEVGDFLFAMSVEEHVELFPTKGSLYGSVAGNTGPKDIGVWMEPGSIVNRTEAIGSPWLLDFPWGNKLLILTYTIEQH
jgi:hypothetical protein